MVTKADFTAEEWLQVVSGPQVAAIVVMLVSPSGPMGMVKEMAATSKLLAETIKTASGNALVDAVAADLKQLVDNKEKLESPVTGNDPHEMIGKSLEFLSSLTALLDQKAPEEAEGYKQWVYKTAQLSSEASKEGGFMGIGGQKVSQQEQAALKDIASRLGITV